jgi:hypothetical protein
MYAAYRSDNNRLIVHTDGMYTCGCGSETGVMCHYGPVLYMDLMAGTSPARH